MNEHDAHVLACRDIDCPRCGHLEFSALSDTDKVLEVLRRHRGQWVDKLYAKTRVMVHSRVADLRRRGFVIECQRFGRTDYRYRLR